MSDTQRTEHNQLAGFLAHAGGPDTKAARQFRAAAERDRKRNDPDEQVKRASARDRRDASARKRNEDVAAEWAAGEDIDYLERRVAKGPQVINGTDYLHAAAVAELQRRKG